MPIQQVQAFIDAVNERNFEEAFIHVTDDAKLFTPMGTKTGKEDIRPMLSMLLNLGSGSLSDAENVDGEIISRTKTPMGKAKLIFSFSGNQIAEIKTKIGK